MLMPIYDIGRMWCPRFYVCIFFLNKIFKDFIYVKSRVTETEREIFHPLLVHSPCGYNGQNWARQKPGASFGSPTGVQGPEYSGHAPLVSQAH